MELKLGKHPTVLADGHHAQHPMTEEEACRREGSWCEGVSKRRWAGSTGSTAGRDARRYGAREVILLYPHHHGLTNKLGRWQSFAILDEDHGKSKHQITVATLDLNNLNNVTKQLQDLFADFLNSSAHKCVPS